MQTAEIILAFSTALFAIALGLTAARKERSKTYWWFAAGMGLLAVESIFAGLSARGSLPQRMILWQNWRFVATSLLPGTWFLFTLSYARGDAEQAPSRRRRLALTASLLVPVSLPLAFHGRLITSYHRAGVGQDWLLDLGVPGFIVCLLFLAGSVAVLVNLEATFRSAAGQARRRIKYMVMAVAVLFAARAYSSSQELLFQATSMSLQVLNCEGLLVGCLLMTCSLLMGRQDGIKLYPSGFVLQRSVTAMVAAIYLLVMLGLARLATLLGGDKASALRLLLMLVAAALLGVMLLSEKVRSQIRRWVNRHFQRPQYDYRTVWRTFTEGTARHVEQQALCQAILKLVSDLFEALSVTLWLVDDKNENLAFAGSTSLTKAQAESLKLAPEEADRVICALRQASEPVNLDSSKEDWVRLLRRLRPDEAGNAGNHICAPLMAHGELIGIMLLGDRVEAAPFSLQDLDLLKSFTDQAAASLLNVRLSQKLSQAKQLEAFQTMSAFFVHDLKNTASTLSLMLENLRSHFQEPRFREDACQAVSEIVTHIKERINGLSLLRQELVVQAVDSDLNQLVAEALTGLGKPPGRQLFQDLRPLPSVKVDPAQIRNVVTNLVLNARDAVGKDGWIRIETSQRNGWVVVGVADNGCGMSPDFVQRRLFRPFQTTKKYGIGIGMFQCQRIIEAHRGRIEVQSAPGKGTAFRVLLPVNEMLQ